MATLISSDVAKDSSLLLQTLFKEFNLSYGYVVNFVVGNIFILRVFSAWLLKEIPVSNQKAALLEITFSKKNRDNLACQFSSKDSNKMNLGNSAASFSESDFDWFYFVFLFEAISNVCSWLVLCSATNQGVQLKLQIYDGGWVERGWGVGTYSLWLRQGYINSILELGVGFRAPGNFKFSADNTNCHTI